MGWAERRNRRLRGLMAGLHWLLRLQVIWTYVGAQTWPRMLRGRTGRRWLLTGKLGA